MEEALPSVAGGAPSGDLEGMGKFARALHVLATCIDELADSVAADSLATDDIQSYLEGGWRETIENDVVSAHEKIDDTDALLGRLIKALQDEGLIEGEFEGSAPQFGRVLDGLQGQDTGEPIHVSLDDLELGVEERAELTQRAFRGDGSVYTRYLGQSDTVVLAYVHDDSRVKWYVVEPNLQVRVYASETVEGLLTTALRDQYVEDVSAEWRAGGEA